MSSTPTTVEDMCPSRDLRNWPHVTWWLHGHRVGEQVNSEFGHAETEGGDCRCEHYGITCGIVPTCWRSNVFDDANHVLVIGSGSGQMRIWARISSRSRCTLIWSSWNRMLTTSLVNLIVGYCMWRTLTNRHIHLWTKLEQSNGWICTRSSTVQPLKKAVFELIKESLTDFHLASSLIDEVQIGSVDSVSKLWEDIFTTFPVDSRPIRFEYIARCILTTYTVNCDDVSTYNSRLSTTHKARVALGGNTTITVDDDFSQTEMMLGLM